MWSSSGIRPNKRPPFTCSISLIEIFCFITVVPFRDLGFKFYLLLLILLILFLMSLECRLFLLTVQRYDSFRCPAIFSLNFRCSSCDKRPHLRQTDKMGVESVAKTSQSVCESLGSSESHTVIIFWCRLMPHFWMVSSVSSVTPRAIISWWKWLKRKQSIFAVLRVN